MAVQDRSSTGRHEAVERAQQVAESVADSVTGGAARAKEKAQALAQVVKPVLRGWLHAGAFPLVAVACLVLVLMADGAAARISCAIFGVTAMMLFGTSAAYHRGHWVPSTERLLKRLDHSNIFLIIAGTYTPFTVLMLPEPRSTILLWVVWVGALAGVAFRVFWVGAPRWLYTPAYIALGWAAVFFLPDFLRYGGPAVLTLVVTGGVLYTVGGTIYALKWPNPAPRWFGFHEIFHALTVAAFVVHYIGIFLVVAR